MTAKRFNLITLCVLIVAGMIVLFSGCNRKTFMGSCIKNPDAYLLDAEQMNKTDQHTMNLQKGDFLSIQFETTSGSLSLKITAPDGRNVYTGNGTAATDFTISISQSGTYTVTVTAVRAKGKIHIQVTE